MYEFLTIVFNGALGGLTFGMWHAFISNKMIEENNKKIESLNKKRLNK
jgi:hypothetical protein